MPFEPVCKLAELPANSVLEAIVRDEAYAICNVNGEISALYGICPHAGGPLGQGQIASSGHLVCPYHMWEFDCKTGESAFNPSIVVPTFTVKVDGGDVLADLP
jgi:nitrite reductase (NADH) small subunit